MVFRKKATSTSDLLKIIGSLLILVIVLVVGYKTVLMGVEGGKQLIDVFKSTICKLSKGFIMCG